LFYELLNQSECFDHCENTRNELGRPQSVAIVQLKVSSTFCTAIFFISLIIISTSRNETAAPIPRNSFWVGAPAPIEIRSRVFSAFRPLAVSPAIVRPPPRLKFPSISSSTRSTYIIIFKLLQSAPRGSAPV
jgi:hypothetical protein